MTTQLALWQELLLLGLAALSLVYVLYFRIWLALAIGSDVLFAVALGLALSSIAAPALFDRASSDLVDRSPLPAALASADAKVAAIEALPRNLIDRALAQIGYEPEPVEGAAASEQAPPPGPFVPSLGRSARLDRPPLREFSVWILLDADFTRHALLDDDRSQAPAIRSSDRRSRIRAGDDEFFIRG
jgi:hypothetical protein